MIGPSFVGDFVSGLLRAFALLNVPQPVGFDEIFDPPVTSVDGVASETTGDRGPSAEDGPASATAPAGVGHPKVTVHSLRVAADGLRDWAAGEPCELPRSFAQIAEFLDGYADELSKT